MDYRMLNLTELNHEHYLKLVDVEKLLHDMRVEIYDRTPQDVTDESNKQWMFTPEDKAVIEALFFVSNCIIRRLTVTCETPEEIKALHERIRDGYYHGKYFLADFNQGEKDGKKEIYYFRKFCPGALEAKLREEGKTEEEIQEALEEKEGLPVFSTNPKDAYMFESMEQANSNMIYINHNYGSNVAVHDALILNTRGAKRFLDALLKRGEEPEEAPEE